MTLEKEGSENNSHYTEKVSKTPKHETVNKTSVASRSQLSTPNRTMQDCYLARKSEQRNNLNTTQNSVQTDIRGKTKSVQENKFQPPRKQKVLNKTAMKLKSAKRKPLEDDKLRLAMETWLGQKTPKTRLNE